MAFWDDMGESLTGITNTISTATQSYVDAWTGAQVDSVRSAAPEQNRVTVEPAQQPTGQTVDPVLYSSPQDGTQKMLVYSVWGLAFFGLYLALKK